MLALKTPFLEEKNLYSKSTLFYIKISITEVSIPENHIPLYLKRKKKTEEIRRKLKNKRNHSRDVSISIWKPSIYGFYIRLPRNKFINRKKSFRNLGLRLGTSGQSSHPLGGDNLSGAF